jgi:hypothetical protein
MSALGSNEVSVVVKRCTATGHARDHVGWAGLGWVSGKTAKELTGHVGCGWF